MKYLLLFGLLLQSCAITKTETRTVPGKELSKVSLGFREIENKKIMKEITPYSVNIFRKVCDAEVFRIEYKAVTETVHERQELYCAEAYPTYIVFQLSTFCVPLLYDLMTGFGIFRGLCDKGPLIISKDIRETGTTLSQETIESKNAVCRDVPISNEEVTVKVENNVSRLMSSAEGVAALTPELLTSIEGLKRDISVRYQYMTEIKETAITRTDKPVMRIAKSDNQNTSETKSETGTVPNGDNPAVTREEVSKLLPAANNGGVSKLLPAANNGGGSMLLPAARSDEVSKFLTFVTQSSSPEPQVMARVDDRKVDARGSKGASGATAENNDLQVNKVSEKTNKLSNDITHIAPVESQITAKVESQNASVRNDKKTIVLNQEQKEIKAYVLTMAFLSLYENGLPRISALRRKKPVHTYLKIEYGFDETDVNEENREDLKILAETLKNNPNTVSVIEGHTDNLGSAEANRKMSLRRASVIKNVFVNRYGIDASRVQIYGYGLTMPIADNTLAEGRAKNRRSEIYTTEAAAGL